MKTEDLMKSIQTAAPDTLHKAYEEVCDTYAQRLIEQLDLNKDDAYWVSDEIGGTFAYSDSYFLGMEDIVLLVDNSFGYDEFNEWYFQYTDFDSDKKRINLRSWLMGARPEMFKDKAMTQEEYRERVKHIYEDFQRRIKELEEEYALSNNPYKVGDIIEDHIGKLKIEEIKTEKYLGDLPFCAYYGIELKKDGTPCKRQTGRHIHQNYIKKRSRE